MNLFFWKCTFPSDNAPVPQQRDIIGVGSFLVRTCGTCSLGNWGMILAVNLQSIYVTDLVGVSILLIILLTKGWRLPARKEESRIMVTLISLSIVNCLVDLVVTLCDGRAGKLYHNISYLGNTYLYLYSLVVGIGIIHMVILHIDRKTTGLHMIFFWMLCVIEAALLILNFFFPIVFRISESNVYERGSYYMLFVIIGFVLILYGYAYYLLAKLQNPSLRYFPVIEFLMPIFLGNIIQMWIYGISILPVCFAIAFAGITISLQNECIYVDKLTGVYNRYELDRVLKSRSLRKNGKVAAMMLDLNGFKAINDTYSHEEGDVALVNFARILSRAVVSDGIVIRFAGDEFIIILHRSKDIDLEAYKAKLQAKVDEYNKTSGKPYALSTAIGGKIIDVNRENVNDLVTGIDVLMYEDKEKYYQTHEKKR